MIFNEQSRKDIERYYTGTYVKFKETGDRIFKIVSCRSEGVKAMDSAGFEVWIDLSEDYHVDYIIPGRKIFQMGECAAMLYRKPARQYFRGMHPENTGFVILSPNGEWKECPVDFGHIESFINKGEYLKPDFQRQHLTSYAVDDQIAIAQNGAIVFGYNPIGYFKPTDKVVMHESMFGREIKDIFKSLAVTYVAIPSKVLNENTSSDSGKPIVGTASAGL